MHVLIFTGGEAPLPETTFSYFKQTVAPDCIIAADAGLDTLSKYKEVYKTEIDFSPDFILGDMDSMQNKKLITGYPEACVEEFPCDKDYTDTELALEKACSLKKSKNDFITMIGGAGGRVDHLLAIYDTFSTAHHADVWLYGEQKLYFASAKRSITINSLNQDDIVSISRTSDSWSKGKITSVGLEWESDHFRKKGMPSMSNRISKEQFACGKPVRLNVESGTFLIIVPLSSEVTITDL